MMPATSAWPLAFGLRGIGQGQRRSEQVDAALAPEQHLVRRQGFQQFPAVHHGYVRVEEKDLGQQGQGVVGRAERENIGRKAAQAQHLPGQG